MKCITSQYYLIYFRSRVLVWALLLVFSWSCLSSVSFAQQPTATIQTVNGTVFVNGQKQGQGALLKAGDVLETQPGAHVTVELSDGSQLDVGENTKVDIAVLSQTATGGRVSRIKLLWGRIRTTLSPEHQQADSSFDIETPNAIVGVKFSQPDVEVSYDPAKQETIGIAHTVELMAKNLVTDEEKLVPVGSTVIITAVTIKILAGTTVVGATSAGMSTGTKVVLGVGAAAAAGGVAALSMSGSEEEEEECFFHVYDVQNNEVVYTSEGTRCTVQISSGFDSETEAYDGLSFTVFEVTVNNTPLQPQGSPYIVSGGDGSWHINQDYQTDELQKGVYRVRGATYRTDLNRLVDSREFTLQVD